MNITKAFDAAFRKMKERNWGKIYVLVDIHDTIIKGCYEDVEKFNWFPYAEKVLRLMSINPKINLILWTSTYEDDIDEYLTYFNWFGITFDFININSEVKNTKLSDFTNKTYFNVGIDDKFGFEPETDWEILYNYFNKWK